MATVWKPHSDGNTPGACRGVCLWPMVTLFTFIPLFRELDNERIGATAAEIRVCDATSVRRYGFATSILPPLVFDVCAARLDYRMFESR